MQAYERLELAWSGFNGLDPDGMVACSSGTAALHLALEAMKLPPGSEVITSDFNMIAVPRAIAMAGLTPVFVDCDERLLMDCDLLDKFISNGDDGGYRRQTEAIIAVHIYGRQCDMERYISWKRKYSGDLFLIEDLAEAHGVKPHSDTDAACWSFYKNKQVAGEEGGAVWFKDPEHAKLARCLRSLGFTADHDFMHVGRGHNYRMSNLHAKPILDSIANYGKNLHGRKMGVHDYKSAGRLQIQEWYDAACPDKLKMPKRDAIWVYDILLPDSKAGWETNIKNPNFGMPVYEPLHKIVKTLNAEGIAARCGFKPMKKQEEFKNCRRVIKSLTTEVSVADRMSARVMYLPVSPGRTTEADCKRAFDLIRQRLAEAG